jgi:hypothetical protein
VKINDIIREDLNTDTGTPNSNPAGPAGANAFSQMTQQLNKRPAQTKKPNLWQRLKKGAQGAVAGVQHSRAQQALTQGQSFQVSKEMTSRELQNWQTYLNQYIAGTGGEVTPQSLKAAATQFTSKRYAAAGPTVLGKVNTVKDVNSANAFITQAFNMAMTNQKAGVSPQTPTTTTQSPKVTSAQSNEVPTTPVSPGVEKTPSGIEIPTNVGGGARKDTTTAAMEPEQQAMAQGIKVVSQEPIILRTKGGKEYGLNDNGQWTHLASGKIPAEAYQQFLSQQHNISLGVN